MLSNLRRLVFTLMVITFIPLSAYAQATVQNIVSQVNQDTQMKFIRQLSGVDAVTINGQPYTIVSRHKSNPSNDQAGNFIQETL